MMKNNRKNDKIDKAIKDVKSTDLKKFVYKKRILKVYLPFGILLPVIFYILDSLIGESSLTFINLLIKMVFINVLILIIGYFGSVFEYNLWDNFEKKILKLSSLKNIYRKYVILKGIFQWGLLIGITITIIEWNSEQTLIMNLLYFIINMGIWTGAGYLYGLIYKKQIKDYIEEHYDM